MTWVKLQERPADVPYGYCWCGCGEPTDLAEVTKTAIGWIKGEPKRFLFNHQSRLKTDPRERLAQHYDLDPASGCWIWRAGKDDRGYGYAWDGTRNVAAHIVTYREHVGPVPAGLELDHTCRTPSCVNPAHLEPVTHRVNVLRGDSPTARNARATSCSKGHPFDDLNTYIRPDGRGRDCVTCRAERTRVSNAKRSTTCC